MATAKELRELKVEDLESRATELRQELFQDLLKLRTGTLDSPAARRLRRKDLARVLTVLTQKKTGTQPVAEAAPAKAPKAAAKKPASPKASKKKASPKAEKQA